MDSFFLKWVFDKHSDTFFFVTDVSVLWRAILYGNFLTNISRDNEQYTEKRTDKTSKIPEKV